MNILYAIACKNVHTFMKKNIWILLANFFKINKHKYLILTMLESLNYSFRNPKKHNLSNLLHQRVEKLQKNHEVLRGPQLDKQR